MCERWVGNWTDCNILIPSSSDYSSTSFLILLCCSSRGPEGQSSLQGAGSHCIELQLTDSNCGTGLYHCLTPTCFPWASQLHRIQPVHGQGYILISSTGCTCFLMDGWVEGQYVTQVFVDHFVFFSFHSIVNRDNRIHLWQSIFVSASHQTGLDTRSMTQRSIIVGI